MKFNDIFKHVYVISRNESKERQLVFEENLKESGIEFKWHYHGTNPCYNWVSSILSNYMSNTPKLYLDQKKEISNYNYPNLEHITYLAKNKLDESNIEEFEIQKNKIKNWVRPGYLATTFAHLELIQIAKNENWDNIVILEDDSICLNNFQNIIESYLKTIPNEWDLLFFGQNIQTWFHFTKFRNVNFVSFDESKNATWIENPGGFSLPCYCINKSMYDKILNFYSKNYDVIDSFYYNIISSKECYDFVDIKAFITNGNLFIANPFIKHSDGQTPNILNENSLGLNQIHKFSEYKNILNQFIF